MLYVKNLYKSYETGKVKYPVLKGIDFHVAQGEFVAVMGPSGSGKTTLLNCISCYIPYDEGEITLGGKSLAGQSEAMLARIRNEKLGFVFQDFMLLDGLTIRENILVPRIVQGEVGADAEALADELVSLFGIGHIMNKYPAEISGGEKQRAAVARSLINNPLMILADEPTGNLDSKTTQEVLGLLKLTGEQFHQTIVMITHNEGLAQLCDRVIHIEDGRIVDDRLCEAQTLYDVQPLHEVQGVYNARTPQGVQNGGIFDEEQ